MIKVPTERKWILCPNCGAKHSIYDDTANCHGVFLKCTRGWGVEFELIIKDGVQILKRNKSDSCVRTFVHGQKA